MAARTTSRWTALLPAVFLIAFALGTTGCNSSEAGAGPESAVAPREAAASESTRPEPPTMDQLITELNLTPEQADALQAPLAQWQLAVRNRQQEHENRAGSRGERGADCDNSGFGRRAGGPGQDETPGQGRHGRAQAGPRMGSGPGREFVQAAAPVLDTDQTVQLLDYLNERRELSDRPARMPMHGGVGMGMMRTLRGADISTDDRASLRDAMDDARDAGRELFESYTDGAITAETLRDGLTRIRTELTTQLEAAVGADAVAEAKATMVKHKSTMATRHIGSLDDRDAERLEFLSAVLELDETQITAVQAAAAGLRPRWEALFAGMGNGSLEPEDALYERIKLQDEMHAAVRTHLNGDQLTVFDALQKHRRGGKG